MGADLCLPISVDDEEIIDDEDDRPIEEISQKRRKTVLVSGCFDLLHSGHIEFFEECEKYGDLTVILGRDDNIFELKNHKPMYNEKERLFMVQNISCVHRAELSTGRGRYDFKADMIRLKPDLYICNDDASKLDGRYDLCKEVGVEIVVLPRKPHEGLEERSSTSMKARLREMIEFEDKDNQTLPMEKFHNIIPWRFCFAGGWMDLKWCNELYHGCVVTINFKHHPGICKDQAGLATSSRKHWRTLWNGKVPKALEAGVAAKYLYGAENFGHFGKYVGSMPEWEKTSYSAGSQDHCGLLFPGISRLNYTGAHWPSSRINLHDRSDPKQAAIFDWLEEHLYILEIPFESRPGNYNSQRINYLTDPDVPLDDKKRMVEALATASDLAWKGIISMDADKLGQGLSDTMKAWEAMLPYTVDPFKKDHPEKSKELREYWTQYDRPHTKGCLFSGAGGGFLMIISDKPIENAMKIQLNTDHIVKPFPSDNVDSEAKPIPFA